MPMPVELVAFHPAMQCLPSAARHIVRAITVAFWLGECRGMPEQSTDLMRAGETDSATWKRHGVAVRGAIAEIMPELARCRAEELEKKATRIRVATRASHARKASQRIGHDAEFAHAAPEPPPEPAHRVARKPTWQGNGRTDMRERALAKARNATVRRDGMMDEPDMREREKGMLANTAGKPLPPPPHDSAISSAIWDWQPTETPPPELQQEAA